MRAPLACLVLLLFTAAAGAQEPPRYVEQDGLLFRAENGELFPVDPSVISLRWTSPPAGPLPAALAAAWEAAGGASPLTLLRSNRLGIADVAIPVGADPRAVVAALAATGRFAFVETTSLGRYGGVPNDPSFGSQWNLHNVGQAGGTPGADVNALAAWELEDGDPSVVIAVLDSGADYNHPDLAAAIWSNPGEVLNGLDDDGNGYVDDVQGWDFGGNDNDPMGAFTHGTWVAGCVAAVSNNGLGIAGLAGGASDGQGCRVMNLNVGSFSPIGSVLDDAILYAVDNGARVITMSLQVAFSSAITAALAEAEAAGVFLVCAAGNNGAGVSFPANQPQVVAVASTNRFDVKSSFSNSGPEVELAAPGEDILMTALGGGYSSSSGTSFAAPHVAALAGLLFSANPELSAAQVREILRQSAVDVGPPGFDTGTGWGRIDAAAALLLARGAASGELLPYGAGLAGTGGKLPVIGAQGGLPVPGNAAFGLTLAEARRGELAILVLGVESGVLPFKGGSLLVEVAAPSAFFSTVVSAEGEGSLALPIPNDAALAGLELFAQWIVSDSAAAQGFALTGGLQLVLGG